jgi:elongation factor Ts
VGRSDDFTRFASVVAEAIAAHAPASPDLLPGLVVGGKTLAEHQNDILAKVGEKIEIRRFEIMKAAAGAVSAYTHLGSKIGVLVELSGPRDTAALVGRDIAMQIAAMNPAVVAREQVDKGAIERELDVYKEQAKNEGKPEHIVERIATGRLEKYFQEVCLTEQTYIKDGTKTVKDVIQEAGAKAGAPLSIVRFVRFQLGEEGK